ncbi:hypothetical protein [Acinetobacter defluvii]
MFCAYSSDAEALKKFTPFLDRL